MLTILIDQDPVFQARSRPSRYGGYYDPNAAEKNRWKWIIGSQTREAPKLPSGAPLHVEAMFRLPIPESLSERKRRALEGQWHTSRGDIDNLQKFAFDAMNKIAFSDDRFISSVYAEKKYSTNPGAKFLIYAHGETMIQEHALTVTKEINVQDLEYLVKKANALGIQHREVFGVFIREGHDERNIFFDCEGPHEHGRQDEC